MGVSNAGDDRILTRPDDLLEPFFEACKPASEFRIGAEQEKVGLLFRGSERPRAILYEPQPGSNAPAVRDVLEALETRFGWTRPDAGGPLIALNRDGASVTLEPGAQLELSGAPLGTIHEIDREMSRHL